MLQYEAGYGVQPAGSRVVHSLRGVLTLRPLDRCAFTLDGQYAQSPTYISRLFDATLAVSF